jgi:hypothetical protein
LPKPKNPTSRSWLSRFPDAKLKTRYQDRLATTYYRQAEKLRDDKKPEEASAFFQKAAQASADTKIRTSSDFDAASGPVER